MANIIETVTVNNRPGQNLQFSPTGVLGSQFDDPGNISGLGSAAILRGTVNLANVAGVTPGAGQSLATRTATAVALQKAITYAEVNGKFMELEPGIYEFYTTDSQGLHFGYSGSSFFQGGGRGGSRLIQFATNVPVATVGHPDVYTFGLKMDGLSVEYGVSQGTIGFTANSTASSNQLTSVSVTAGYSNGMGIMGPGIPSGTTISSGAGTATLTLSANATNTATGYTFMVLVSTTNTSANTLWLGYTSQSVFTNFSIGPQSDFSLIGYRGVYHGNVPEFQNEYSNFQVVGGQFALVEWQQLGTGSVWRDWFCRAGPGLLAGPGAINGPYAWNCGAVCDGGMMERINMEAIAANACYHTEVCRGLMFNDCHLETYWMTGFAPTIFKTSFSRLIINNFDMDFVLTPQGGGSTYGSFMGLFGGDSVQINNLRLTSQSSDLGAATLPFRVFDGTTATPDSLPTLRIANMSVEDFNGGGIASQVLMCTEMPLANYTSPAFVNEFIYNGVMTCRKGASITVSATYTVFGAEQNVTVFVPVSITSFNLTLSNSWNSGAGTAKPAYGSFVHVRRMAGTASGTLTVKDGAGATLTTNTTAATDYYYQFTGTAWVLVT